MIWFTQKLALSNQPKDTTVELLGIYNHKGSLWSAQNIIEIIIRVYNADGTKDILLYSHNPSMMKIEDPSPEEVLYKYRPKINKFLTKYKDYEEIKNKLV